MRCKALMLVKLLHTLNDFARPTVTPKKNNDQKVKFDIFVNFCLISLIFWMELYLDHEFFLHLSKWPYDPFLSWYHQKTDFSKFRKGWKVTSDTKNYFIFETFHMKYLNFRIRVKNLTTYFSTIQNVIWARFDWCRSIWKFNVLTKISRFFHSFLHLKYRLFWIWVIRYTCRF